MAGPMPMPGGNNPVAQYRQQDSWNGGGGYSGNRGAYGNVNGGGNGRGNHSGEDWNNGNQEYGNRNGQNGHGSGHNSNRGGYNGHDRFNGSQHNSGDNGGSDWNVNCQGAWQPRYGQQNNGGYEENWPSLGQSGPHASQRDGAAQFSDRRAAENTRPRALGQQENGGAAHMENYTRTEENLGQRERLHSNKRGRERDGGPDQEPAATRPRQ